MPPCKCTHRAQSAGGLRIQTSLERLLGYLQDRTGNDEAVVAMVAVLMRQGRLRRPGAESPARQDKAA